MSLDSYKVGYPETFSGRAPNIGNPNNYQSKISRMSLNHASEIDRYSRPDLPSRAQIKYKYDELNNLTSVSNLCMQTNFERPDYPTSGKHSRFPVLISCDDCGDLTMTDTQYQHGCASKAWCILLLPFFCTGFCCLCLNSCKDVRHFCSRCRRQRGVCKSKCI